MAGKFKPSVCTTRGTTFDEGLRQPHKTLEKDNCSTDSASVSSLDEYELEYSLGDHDIADLIRAIDLTQLDGDEDSPHSNTWRTSIKEDEDNASVVIPTTKVEDPVEPICLSPSQRWQHIFTKKKLPYGAQYEINRLVNVGKLTYDDMLFEDVIMLAKMGTNQKAAPATARVMLKRGFENDESDASDHVKIAFAKERAARCPWQELDREEEALQKSPYGGLGFNDNNEPLKWHGGRVLFHAKLQVQGMSRDSKTPQYKLTLEPAELSSSHSFARRFGSKHFLRVKLAKGVVNKNGKQLMDYFRRPIILCGSVFRAFFAKEHNVFYVKTNEGTNGESVLPNAPVPGVMSFLGFIEWYNPLDLNSKQTMAKYASRFALGLSNSVPGIMVDASKLRFIDDIVSHGPGTQSVMTDGAGKTNRWTLKQLRHRVDWEDKPTAVQIRIHGTKGLLVEDIKNVDDSFCVELTDSQRKIKYPSGGLQDPAHYIIDVLRSSHVRTPCRLSIETIINLSENGVPKTVFLDLLHQGLKELVEPLLQWEDRNAMLNLWCNMCRLGGVMSARRAREEPGLARVKGYSERGSEEDDLGDEDDLFDTTEEEKSSAWWRDEISGCPSSLEETVMCLLDSGFTPQNCPILRSKLERVIENHVKHYIKSYRINVPMSATAFLIPDTLGILEPDEIFFKHSKSDFQTLDGSATDVLLGTVLVTRYPCKLPTDVQKWKAVDKLELHHLVDVVILSTKGSRRAADLLSGGDYDGDKGLVIYQPELVEAFKEPPLHYSKPPPDIDEYFKPDNEEVVKFSARVDHLDSAVKIYELQKYLLLTAVRGASAVGMYSKFHDNATYTLGYTHPESIRLAYMFCMCLDGLKSGKAVKDEILKNDIKVYQKRPPEWKETDEERNQFYASCQNEKNLQRPIGLGGFIMDDLHAQAKEERGRWLSTIENHFGAQNHSNVQDEDLVAPWNRAIKLSRKWATEEKNTRMEGELDEIVKHVQHVYEDHRTAFSASVKKASSFSQKSSHPFTDLPIEARQDVIRKLSRKFVSFPPPEKFIMHDAEIARLRASYAYKYDYDKRHSSKLAGTSFPWDVAMRELCAIKAQASGGYKTIVGEFYDHFNMKRPRDYNF